MTNGDHIGPKVDPPWWDFVRQLTVFLLGIGFLIYSAATPGHDIPFLIVGLVLIGLVPIDNILSTWRHR